METARRLGAFFLVLAFILYLASRQAESADPELQGRLVVFRILFALLGFILVTRYRSRARESSRFSGIRNLLFKRKERSRGAAGRGDRRGAIGDPEPRGRGRRGRRDRDDEQR